MAYTTIDDPSAYFHTQLYTGNGSSGLSITNDANAGDFQADWLWIKPRSASDNNVVFDSSRGEDKQLKTNGTDAEDTHSPARVTFESDGFDLDTTDGNYNGNGTTYVAWQWKANGGTTSSNSDGSITSTVQANTTAGFSIITYTGNGTAGATVGHGLGAVPSVIINKGRDEDRPWAVYHHKNTSAPETDYLRLDTDTATTDEATIWADTAPTSAVFTAGDHSSSNRAGDSFVGYFWNEVQGYSKFGTFTGNGNDDGPFVYTGFRPAWTMIKCTSAADHWPIDDNKRSPHNFMQNTLRANLTNAEYTGSAYGIDFLSNGFKVRNDDGQYNLNNGTFVYMAFAESPFVNSNGVPANAR